MNDLASAQSNTVDDVLRRSASRFGHRIALRFGERTWTYAELDRAVDAVAARLCNTRAVCRRCYIHPAIVETFLDGYAIDEAATPRPAVKGLNADEAAVLMLLDRLRRRRPTRVVPRAAAA